jgi:hypothetical protein
MFAADGYECDTSYRASFPKTSVQLESTSFQHKTADCEIRPSSSSSTSSVPSLLKCLEAISQLAIGKDIVLTPEQKKILSQRVSPENFDVMAEKFPSLKMEYDYGKIKIIEVQGRGHQAVISEISFQFKTFQYRNNLMKETFASGGGLTNKYVNENGIYSKVDKKADPDEALNVFLGNDFVYRLIFEVEIHNRNFVDLDKRMRSLLDGWKNCLIGIACKFFPRRDEGGPFEGVLLVYYKRDGRVALEKLCDIGTKELSAVRRNMLLKIEENARLEIPDERCVVVQKKNRLDKIVSTKADFYRIELDSSLLFQGTEVEQERPSLILDFLQIVQKLHRVEGKLFSGALQD